MSAAYPLGISLSILPEPALTACAYRVLQGYPIAAVEVGYEQVAAALLEERLFDQLVQIGREAHPPIVSLHAPYRPDRDLSLLDDRRRRVAVASTLEVLALAHRMGVELVIIHASEDPIRAAQRSARRAQARRSLAELARAARRLGVRLAVELMPPEWLPAGVAEAEALLQGLDPAIVGLCLDTNHANLTGDLPTIVRALGSRLWEVHVSDNDGRQQRHWLPFRGTIGWGAFMGALRETDYRGPLVYELDPHPSGLSCALAEIVAVHARLLFLH